MLETTSDAVRAILKSDPTINPGDRTRMLSLLRDGPRLDTNSTERRIIRRAEAAKLLGRSLRGVDLLREQGHLKPVIMPGRTRGGGFRIGDVYALMGIGGAP